MTPIVSITGLASFSGLGCTMEGHAQSLELGKTALRPLRELDESVAKFRNSSKHKSTNGTKPQVEQQAAWIQPRSLTLSRKWAPCSKLAIEVAKLAVEDAQLSSAELKNCAVIAGSSRGNAWLKHWPGRRPLKLMAASNSMHGEIASAVSIELGTQGPWQLIASGCAASLDALGTAFMMLRAGIVSHAIVIGVELPLTPEVLQDYIDTGVLSSNGINDPYHPETSGFFPGEAASAIVLQASKEPITGCPTIESYHCTSDARSPIGMPKDGAGLRRCIEATLATLPTNAQIRAVCPHASGTALHAQAEQTALLDTLKSHALDEAISLHLLKPFTGHTVGASGALDTTILAHYLRNHSLPPNLPGLSSVAAPFSLPTSCLSIQEHQYVLKFAVGMGGHNSIVSLKAPAR